MAAFFDKLSILTLLSQKKSRFHRETALILNYKKYAAISLRWNYPGQVQRVWSQADKATPNECTFYENNSVSACVCQAQNNR